MEDFVHTRSTKVSNVEIPYSRSSCVAFVCYVLLFCVLFGFIFVFQFVR